MSSVNFDNLIDKFPDERSAIEALGKLVSAGAPLELTFEHLAARVHPSSMEVLAVILAELTRSGDLSRIIRVESRDQGGIRDFESIQDVPERMHDWRTDEDIEVTPDRLRVIYKASGRG